MDAPYDPREDALSELFDLIAGSGKYAGLGSGLTTFPGESGEWDRDHAMCAELERRGLVRRKQVEGGVEWVATGLRLAE